MLSRKFIIWGIVLIAVAILILVALGIWLGSAITGGNSSLAASPYSVVYLSDGEIYFGKLSWFPRPAISDPWTIQRTVDKNNNVQTSIVEVNKAAWSPVDELYLNPKQIMAWSSLRADGNLAKALANPQSVQQQSSASGASGSAPTDNTFKGPTTQPPATK